MIKHLKISLIALFIAQSLSSKAATGIYETNFFSVGAGPFSIVQVDVNGDGKPDLITANQDNDTVTVLTNNGVGNFALKATLTAGPSAQYATAADVNGDGKPDIICANAGLRDSGFQGTLTVFTNNGTGGFAILNNLSVGSYATWVAAADVNGDGKPDLISADSSDNTLTVLTNNGSGLFSTSMIVNVGNYPVSVAVADVNGDGKPDLICADQDDGQLMVQTNLGGGQFAFSASYFVGSGSGSLPYAVATADLNGDGKPDLISVNNNNNSLTVLTNNGSGLFNASSSPIVGNLPRAVAIADVNGDGKPDLISADSSDDSITVLTNRANGLFKLQTHLDVGTLPSAVLAGDLNGDGSVDIATANNFSGNVSVLLQLVAPKLVLHQPETPGNPLALTWTSSFASFVVQTNGNLSNPSWVVSDLPVTVSGGTNYSLLFTSPPPSQMFFRLVKP